MGQGGKLLLVNKTPYRWKRTHRHSYQMKSWDNSFPEFIEPGAAVQVYIEWMEGTKNKKDDAGEINYTLEGINYTFQVQARAKNGFDIRVAFIHFPGISRGEISLGWNHDGTLFFTLMGYEGNMDFIASNQVQNKWMTYLPDDALLSHLTIPGTHDTCTYGLNEGLIKGLPNEVLLPWGPAALAVPIVMGLAKCQDLSLREQLDRGIRFLDIRLKKDGDKLEAYHDDIRLHMNFEEIATQCYNFLDTNDKETIIVSIKNEGNISIEELVKKEIGKNVKYWCTEETATHEPIPITTIPRLGKVRKKLVLLRRFGPDNMDYGINACPAKWGDKKSFEIPVKDTGKKLVIQDEYVVPTLFDIHKKWEKVQGHFERAGREDDNSLFINFASGTSGGAYPYSVAYKGDGVTIKGVNQRMLKYFESHVPGSRCGIVVLDFPEKTRDLVTALISCNNFSTSNRKMAIGAGQVNDDTHPLPVL